MTKLPVVILGAGGHGRVVLDAARRSGLNVVGFADSTPAMVGKTVDGVLVFGDDEELMRRCTPGQITLLNGLGSVRATATRRKVFDDFAAQGYRFASLIHPSVVVAAGVTCGDGAQLLAGVTVSAGVVIGANTIINTGAIVDHECQVGDHVHLAPGVTLSGNVEVGVGAHLGTGAVVIQGIRIGAGATIGAGAVVIRDVAPGTTVVGVPARERAR